MTASALAHLSSAVRALFEQIAAQYVREGYHVRFRWRPDPEDAQEMRICPGLTAAKLMEDAGGCYGWTDVGRQLALELHLMSTEAAALLADAKSRYQPGQWFGEGELIAHRPYAFSELVARKRFRKGEGDTYCLLLGPYADGSSLGGPLSDPHGSDRADTSAQKETKMSEEARTVFERIRRGYMEAGCPPRHNKSFGPQAGENRGFTELVARGWLKLVVGKSHILTEEGLAAVMAP